MNRGLRTMIVLAVALLAAFAASYFAYVGMRRMALNAAGPGTTPVVVAAREIPLGTLITREHLRLMDWPANSPVTGALTRLEDAIDRGAIMGIAVNEPLTNAKVAEKGVGAGLPPTITPGMRAISLKVNEVVGVAGFDVLVTIEPPEERAQMRNRMTRVVVSNVQVLTAGTRIDQETATKEGKPIPSTVVTVLVLPEDAERLALAQNEGQITLTLRNPLDAASTGTPGARLANLLGHQTDNTPVETKAAVVTRVRPRIVQPAAPPPAPKAYTVETIRGAKRTEETVK
jgi:pilus assembly protein CpaB